MIDRTPVRPARGLRRPGPWFVAAVVLAAVALPGGLAAAHAVRVAPEVGMARPLASTPTFSVALTDAPSFEPRYLNATVNGTVSVTVDLNNTGTIAHTFTVVNANQSGVVLNRLWSPAKLDRYFAVNGTLADVNVSAGTTAVATFALSASTTFRSFEFVSTIPYQFQAGMWGFLNLTPTGPTLLLSDNTTNNLQFVPSVLSAGATAHGAVSFHILVTNLGDLSHTFTVSSQVNITLTSIGNFSKYSPLVNVSVPSSSGGTVWANFTVPGTGVYEFACTVPGHFTAGMFGFLYVGVAVPPSPASPSTAIVEAPILVGSGVLLGIGLFLALISTYTGRFSKPPVSHGPHP